MVDAVVVEMVDVVVLQSIQPTAHPPMISTSQPGWQVTVGGHMGVGVIVVVVIGVVVVGVVVVLRVVVDLLEETVM